MRKYYSQNGEDFLLWSLFDKKSSPGTFIEVGALDGIRFSNTYSFEREGWKGICVEPHPDFFSILTANRPRSICVQVAVSKDKGQVEFYAEPRGEFSTLVEQNTQNETIARKMAGYKKITVSTLTLDAILRQAGITPYVDIVSIDVEGAELDVLDGFDINLYKPYVLVIEANTELADKKLDAYMRRYGYYKAGRLGRSNNFYCRSWFVALKLSLLPIQCIVNVQPLPNENKVLQKCKIDLPSLAVQSFQKLFNRILARLKIKKT